MFSFALLFWTDKIPSRARLRDTCAEIPSKPFMPSFELR
jgi:hypothetical protein